MQSALTYVQVLVMYVGLLLVGQGAVYMLSFGKHETNAVYRFFRFVTSPVVNLFARVVPAKVAPRHVPVVTFFMLFWIYFGLAVLIPKLGRVA
jgi:uncharacterized protein YggT (Ycf19 family)